MNVFVKNSSCPFGDHILRNRKLSMRKCWKVVEWNLEKRKFDQIHRTCNQGYNKRLYCKK